MMQIFTENGEALYYYPGEGQKQIPVDAEAVEKMVDYMNAFIGDELFTMKSVTYVDVYGEDGQIMKDEHGQNIQAATSFAIGFTGISDNQYVSLGLDLCDVTGNSAGVIDLSFVDMEYISEHENVARRRSESYWQIED